MVELFEYWANYPPVHLMVRAYLGIGSDDLENKPSPEQNVAMLRAVMEGARAPKLNTASPEDQARFKAMEEKAKKLAG